jgi:phage-related protein
MHPVVAPIHLAWVFQFWDNHAVSAPPFRALVWVGSSLKDLRAFPEEVRQIMGFALYLAQCGGKHPAAKPLRGFGGAGVLEVVDDHEGDAYRAVYTVRFSDRVYVLHAFQKKSTSGVATPRREMALIRDRLSQVRLEEQRMRRGGGA